MPKKILIRTRYETEVRISLLLLILSLFLMNFLSIYLFYNTQQALHAEFRQKVSYLGSTARGLASAGLSGTELSSRLRELAISDEIRRIDLYTENGALYASSQPGRPGEALRPSQPWSAKLRQSPVGPFFGEIYRDADGRHSLDYCYPFSDYANNQKYWAVIQANAQPLVSLEKGSRLTFWLLAIGFLAAFIITIYLIKSTLKPYQVIKQEAAQANLLEASSAQPGQDLVVEIFKRTIAELKQKEKILQELYQDSSRKAEGLSRLNEYILAGIESGVIICNPQGEITKVNQAALHILDFSEPELLGKMFFDRFGEESPLAQLVQEALLERKTCLAREIEFNNHKHKRVILEVNTSLIKDDREQLLGVTLLFSDITQLIQLREELVFKEKMAAIGEMTAGLAHQLRNSMGSIYGFANLLRKSIGEPNQLSQIIDEIGRETKSLETLMEKFLNFSKPLQLQMERLNLAYLVQESYQSVAKYDNVNRPVFEIRIDDGLPAVWGDRLLLKQCFQNLFQNALEAMPQGGKLEVRITKSGRGEKQEGVLLQVTDTGAGMTTKELEKIFEPFYSTKAVGTGLGLSLARKIITEHGGKIEAGSKKQQGSTFRIFLPGTGSQTPDRILKEV